jgi:hypothetical protein
MVPRIPLGRLSVLCLAAALLAPAATADVLFDVFRLRTGESVKGRPIRERTDDRVLVFEDLLTGSIRSVSWEAIEPADRTEVLRGLGRLLTASYTTPGVRLTVRVAGEDQELYGVIEGEDAKEIRLTRNGETVPVPKERVVERTPETLDVREVWSPSRLMKMYDAKLRERELDPAALDGKNALDRGEYAELMGALRESLESYQRAAADIDYADRATAEQRAVRVEALLRDQAALATIRDLKTKLGSDLFKAVGKGLADFATKHPNASEGVTKALETLKAAVKARRDKFMRQQVRYNFPRICVRLIEAKVKEKDIKLNDAKSWTKRGLQEAAFAALVEKLSTKDDVTPAEVEGWWETRWERVPKTSWLSASYGSGSFIAYPPKVLPPKSRAGGGGGGGGRGGGGNQGPAPTLTLPKPPTHDQWWTNNPLERAGWVMAHFVQTSGLFEVADDLGRSPCSLCLGEGIRTKVSQTGDVIPYLCNRCAGGRYDLTVKYR